MKNLIFCCAFVSLSSFGLAQELEEVSILSSMDKTPQPSFAYAPDSTEKPIPLLVVLHTWSGDYKQKGHIEVALKECRERKWALIHPNFRGPNWTPEALGSPLAVQDIVDAIEWMKQQHSIDTDRIYLTGVSGGGHMSMQMAGKHPEIWAGVSAWVGISDVAAWHSETKSAGRNYFKNVEKAVGGAPGTSQQVDEQLKERSPLTWLARARSLPIDLNAGIHDGHTGSVPISQTFHAFNVLADANDQRPEKFSKSQIETMTKTQEIPQDLQFTGRQEDRKHDILLRRQAGPVRITIFEGGHEGDLPTAIQWLSMQSR
ncbi:alpha/beta hydrolase family protein [Thalassoglobus polymorphus]|uniref:Prolyl oligopeptidase family protein n=1 Tax=Thalassoglobus polymorphus TaxID=2527994 RepID=A0A517QI74_9PLAN|nr:alpha/beta fold hydrolase [Thalassoglobus polymorphus]QDT31331.1 Prolyl oligopeptidase family protein [Thalassoglobus polymorphus]